MDEKITRYIQKSIKNWWISILIGLLSIGLGIWCSAAPQATILALSLIFIVGFLVSGLFNVIFSLSNRSTMSSWHWSLISGIIDIGIALLLMLTPTMTPILMIFFFGFWIMFQSFWGVTAAAQLRNCKVKGAGFLLFLSVLGILLAFFLIARPQFALGLIVGLTSIGFIIYGIIRLYYGWKLKEMKNFFDQLDKQS